MSSTNKTTNYELSQFIGTDKPAWLTDYNSDMGKIDTGINTAQTTATGADGKATANTTAIGDLTNLTTTAKTNLVAAVNEVKTGADAAATVAASATAAANNAATTATQASTKVNNLASYLTITNIVSIQKASMVASSGGTINRGDMKVATNASHTLGKIYGYVEHTPASGNATQSINLNVDTGLRPASRFMISPAGICNTNGTSSNQVLRGVAAYINTNGTIDLTYWADDTNKHVIYLLPCIYFFEDFGDES